MLRTAAPLSALLLAPLLLSIGCGDSRPAPSTPFSGMDSQPSTSKTRDAEGALTGLDAALDATRTLPPAQCLERQRALGPRVASTVDACAGTRFENKAVYIQAQWCFNFNDDGAGVDAALDRLEGLEQPLFKRSGRALRVQHLLREERRVPARAMAETLVGELPEFTFLLGMVRWHERIGGTVESTRGVGLDGVEVDPAAGSERWVLYVHLAVWNDQAVFTVQRWLQAIGGRDIRLVPVVRDGSAKRMASDLAAMPAAAAHAVPLYCRSQAEVDRVLKEWQPPLDGWTVLLDRDRRIARVEVRPGDLASVE